MAFEIRPTTEKPTYTIVPPQYRHPILAAQYLAAVAMVVSLTGCPGTLTGVPAYDDIYQPLTQTEATTLIDSLFADAWGVAPTHNQPLSIATTDSLGQPFTIAFEADGIVAQEKVAYEIVFDLPDTSSDSSLALSTAEELHINNNNGVIDDQAIFLATIDHRESLIAQVESFIAARTQP